MGLGEEDNRDKVPFSSYHGNSTYYQHYLSLLVLTLITWLKLALRFLHCKIILFPPFCTVLPLWKKVTMCSSCFKSRKLCSTSLGERGEGMYLHKLFGILLPGRFVSSIYLFISVWAHIHNIYVTLWVVIQYTLFISPGKNTGSGLPFPSPGDLPDAGI